MRKPIRILTTTMAMIVALTSLSSQVLAGDFSRQEYKFSGSWTIEKAGDDLVLKLSDDFKTRSGPDLKIFLSPTDIGSITGKTATKGSVLVSRLESNKGEQSYRIPAGTDLSQFKSIVVHCEKFSKLWGGDSLEALVQAHTMMK